jgi:putative sigma-54 modulation protein
MDIQIHSVHFDADRKLINFIHQKVKKLGQYNDRILGAEIFLRLDKSQDTENKITEIKIDIPKNPLFARKRCKSFEEATDEAVDALKRQITKQKDRLRGV